MRRGPPGGIGLLQELGDGIDVGIPAQVDVTVDEPGQDGETTPKSHTSAPAGAAAPV